MNLYPGFTSIVKIGMISFHLPLKIFPGAVSHSKKKFPYDNMSTGLSDNV